MSYKLDALLMNSSAVVGSGNSNSVITKVNSRASDRSDVNNTATQTEINQKSSVPRRPQLRRFGLLGEIRAQPRVPVALKGQKEEQV